MFLYQTMGLAAAIEGVKRETSENNTNGNQEVDSAQAGAVGLFIGHLGGLQTDGRQFFGILSASLCDGGVERLADVEGNGHSGVTTTSLHVGLKLRQHHFL